MRAAVCGLPRTSAKPLPGHVRVRKFAPAIHEEGVEADIIVYCRTLCKVFGLDRSWDTVAAVRPMARKQSKTAIVIWGTIHTFLHAVSWCFDQYQVRPHQARIPNPLNAFPSQRSAERMIHKCSRYAVEGLASSQCLFAPELRPRNKSPLKTEWTLNFVTLTTSVPSWLGQWIPISSSVTCCLDMPEPAKC